MKYLFLDVDGVLNTPASKSRCGFYIGIDSEKVLLLKQIVERTGAQIVLHSTWKENWERDKKRKPLQDELANYLDKKLQAAGLVAIDKTPDYADGRYLSRGEGIVEYLNAGSWESFVILDDLQFDYDSCGLTDYFVRTDKTMGLTPELAERAIRILEKNKVARNS